MKDSNFLKFLFLFVVIFIILISKNYAKINSNDLNNKIKNNNLSLENIPRITLPYLGNYESNYNDDFHKKNQLKSDNELGLVGSSLDNKGFIFKYQSSQMTEPKISAIIALVADLKSGDILWSKNLNKRWPIASLTKLITAAYVLKNFDLKTKITIPKYILNNDQTSSTKNISEGDIYLVGDLVKLMLLSSSNEAAEVLANLENRDSFILGMNDLVKEWGLAFTYFADPTGLSVSNQSTGSDLLKIIYKIKEQYPDILRWSVFKTVEIKEISSKKFKKISNIHPFAGAPNFLGGKTGSTSESKQNLISVFSVEGRPVVILVLGSDDRALDTQSILEWFELNFQLVK